MNLSSASRLGLHLFMVVILLVMFGVVMLGIQDDNVYNRVDDSIGDVEVVNGDESNTYEVIYLVTGDTYRADVLICDRYGKMNNVRDVGMGWQYKFEAQAGAHMYLQASNSKEEGHKQIIVELYIDGVLRDKETDVGAYPLAVIDKYLPD
ncbi:MAG: hypothetical protein SVY53_12030 [Chloroflexota bacterium]|nr:hypothetical protein [Chloroflexota bacterium]